MMTELSEKKEIRRKLGVLLKKEMGHEGVSDQEIRQLFDEMFDALPGFTAETYQELVDTALDFRLFHEPLRLMKRWNAMTTPERRLAPEVFLTPAKNDYREQLAFMAAEVKKTTYLTGIFDEKWFGEVDGIIERYTGEEAFGTDTHTAFIGFIQEGSDLLQRLDSAYGEILRSIGQNRITRLRTKLQDFARPLTDYLGTVFEVLILGPCAKMGYLKEIEPKRGSNHADGLVTIEGVNLLIEATVSTAGRPLASRAGAFDPEEGKDKICRKIVDKAEQLKEATEPILLFLNPYLTTFRFEAKLGINAAFEKPECGSIVGVVLASDYRAGRLKAAWNTTPATRKIPDTVRVRLESAYGLQPLDMTNLWNDR